MLAYVLARQITLPLKNIQYVAERLSSGHYDERVKSDLPSTDEVRHLIDAFNLAVEQIERTMEQKKRLDEMRREFLANVSHEFRAPLSSMQGFLELMIDGKIDRDRQLKYLLIMYDDTQLLVRLVKDLLELSRLEEGQIRLEKKPASVRELVQQSVERMQPLASEKEIQIRFEMYEDDGMIDVDRQRIQQVLNNLLENSIRHTDIGGHVQISVNMVDEEISFAIQDNGCGIPEEELPYIWERFYKVDKARTRSVGGTGLGLAIVKQLVELHQGQIEAASTIGQGTTIRFALPRS